MCARQKTGREGKRDGGERKREQVEEDLGKRERGKPELERRERSYKLAAKKGSEES